MGICMLRSRKGELIPTPDRFVVWGEQSRSTIQHVSLFYFFFRRLSGSADHVGNELN